VRGRIRLAWLCLAALVPPAAALAGLEDAALPDPGSPGSHAAYAQQLGRARDSEYARLLARYDAHLAAHPRDALAATERCRFVERAQAEVEHADPEACTEALARRFPDHPEVVLFRAETLAPEDVIALEAQVAQAEGWSEAQRARLLERAARALFDRGRVDQAFRRARRATRLDPTLPLGRVLAEGWRRRGKRDRAVAALVADLDRAPSWELAARVQSLVDLGAWEAALLAIEQARGRTDAWIDPVLHARALEGAGRGEAARERYREAAETPWSRDTALRRLFELALRGGSALEARHAYLELRDAARDPLARLRLALASAFPGVPWDARDLLALGKLALALAALAAAPLAWVMPLHYLALRRGRGNAPDLDGERRWGALHLWYAGALLGLAHFLCLYAFLYGDLERWLGIAVDVAAARDPAALARYGAAIGAVYAAGAILPLRRADWQRALACRWSVPRTLLVCAAALVLVRGAAFACASWVDESSAAAPASLTRELLRAFGERYGAVALLAYAVLLIPLCEELLFRGMMLGAASRFVGFGAASLFQALLFALFHEQLAFAPFYVVVGLVCAALRRSSGGLRAPLLVHAANNAIAVWALLPVL
jgi:hypothetical protein